MSPTKKSKNINQSTKSLKSQNVRSPVRSKKAAAEWRTHAEARKIMSNKVTTPILKEILAHANISAILKEPGDAFQEVGEDESFNPPLHSTAVSNDLDDDDDDVLQTNEIRDQIPAKLMSPIASVVEAKRMRPMEPKQSPAPSTDPSAQRPDTTIPKETTQMKAQKVPEPLKKQAPSRGLSIGEPSSAQDPNTAPNRTVSLQKNTQEIPESGPPKTRQTARTQATREPSATQGPNTAPNRKTPQTKAQKVPEPFKKQAPSRGLSIGEPSSAQGPNTAPKRTVKLQKKTQKIPEPGPSKKYSTVRTRTTGKPSSTQGPNSTPNRRVTQQLKTQKVPEPSKKQVPARTLSIGEPSSVQGPHTAPNRTVVSAKNAKAQRKEDTTSSKKKSTRDNTDIAAADTSGPEIVSKSVKNGNELEFLLLECGKVIESYRDEAETDDCRRAIDVFSHTFKEQLSTTISELQKLKDLKRKNAKMQFEIGMKRKRLLQVKNDIIAKQPKLNQLQMECSELEQKQKSLKSAREILDNLTHFQEDYRRFKAENPDVEETYGTCSLPALCLEAGNIMKAEQHFHIVNRKLQSVIDKEKVD